MVAFTLSRGLTKSTVKQACFFTGFPAIQDNGISLIMSLKKCLSLGGKSLSLEEKSLSLEGKS